MASRSSSMDRVSQIDPLRKLLMELSNEIDQVTLDGLKFLVALPDAVSEKIDSALKLFMELMKMRKIHNDDVDLLVEIFGDVKRNDLKEKVKHFQRNCVKHKETPSWDSSSCLSSSSALNQNESSVSRRFSDEGTDSGEKKTSKLKERNCMSVPSSPPEGDFQDSFDQESPQIKRCLNEETKATTNEKRRDSEGSNKLHSASAIELRASFNSSVDQSLGEIQRSESETDLKKLLSHHSNCSHCASQKSPETSENKNLSESLENSDEILENSKERLESSKESLESSNERSSYTVERFNDSADIDIDGLQENMLKATGKTDASHCHSKSVIESQEKLISERISEFSTNQRNENCFAGKLSNGINQLGNDSKHVAEINARRTLANGWNSTTGSDVVKGSYSNLVMKYTGMSQTPTRETIVMRNYQIELSRPGIEGKNSIICAPTGSGKTITAGFICQSLRKTATAEKRRFKTLFIVCIRNLVLQQRDALSLVVVNENGKDAVGGIRETLLLSEYVKTYDVVVLTAQILVNSLKNNEIKISDVDLLIMDECHHTILNHPYNAIMAEYHRMKREDPRVRLPQVLALTASLGVGSTGDDQTGAFYHYIRLCANLDCRTITHVRNKEHLEELLRYNPRPKIDQIITAEPRSANCHFNQVMNFMMTEVERMTMFPTATACHQYGSQQYENWVVKQKIEAEKRDLVDCIISTEALQRFNAALMLFDELRAVDAFNYLDNFFSFSRPASSQTPGTVAFLINKLYREMKPELESVVTKETIRDSPKLYRFYSLITDLYVTNNDSRGIILTRTRLGVAALFDFVKEMAKLKDLVFPAKLVGQGRKDGTMTDVEQENVLRRFRQGRNGPNRCNLIIATDVAQEGLDMPKCNFVIRYNFVSNEIGSVQSKGRARAPNSECYLIVDRNSINEKKEYENLEKEYMMMQALEDIETISEDELQQAINLEQEKILSETEQRILEKDGSTLFLDADHVTLHCRYCKMKLCRASDMRLRVNNYICVAVDELLSNIFVKRMENPDDYRLDTQIGVCYCCNPNCSKIVGTQLKYKQGSRHYGYALSKHNIMWKHDEEMEYHQIKKWSTIPFKITEEPMFPTLT